MAEMSSLLSHLALKSFRKPELFVTEGLGYLLAQSTAAHEAVRAILLNDLGLDIGETLFYDTQKGLDEGGLRTSTVLRRTRRSSSLSRAS
jgi:hypothetical protein